MSVGKRPWGVHSIFNMFGGPDVSCGLPDGRIVTAVYEPYDGNRLQAAWWVLTGRAYAVQWPAPGDLEAAVWRRPPPSHNVEGGQQ
jgi:hypothetical protein